MWTLLKKKKSRKLFILVLRDCKTALVFPFPALFPLNRVFFKVFKEKTKKKKRQTLRNINDVFCQTTLKRKLWMDRRNKTGRNRPCQRMELVHSEDASKTLSSQLQSVSAVIYRWLPTTWLESAAGVRVLMKTSRAQRVGNHCGKPYWFSLNSAPGFPRLPFFTHNSTVGCVA